METVNFEDKIERESKDGNNIYRQYVNLPDPLESKVEIEGAAPEVGPNIYVMARVEKVGELENKLAKMVEVVKNENGNCWVEGPSSGGSSAEGGKIRPEFPRSESGLEAKPVAQEAKGVGGQTVYFKALTEGKEYAFKTYKRTQKNGWTEPVSIRLLGRKGFQYGDNVKIQASLNSKFNDNIKEIGNYVLWDKLWYVMSVLKGVEFKTDAIDNILNMAYKGAYIEFRNKNVYDNIVNETNNVDNSILSYEIWPYKKIEDTFSDLKSEEISLFNSGTKENFKRVGKIEKKSMAGFHIVLAPTLQDGRGSIDAGVHFGLWTLISTALPGYNDDKVAGSIIHEIGHLLGMVPDTKERKRNKISNYTAESGPHCTNQNCVMYKTQKDVNRPKTFCDLCQEELMERSNRRIPLEPSWKRY